MRQILSKYYLPFCIYEEIDENPEEKKAFYKKSEAVDHVLRVLIETFF
jgi:hypothetical protein